MSPEKAKQKIGRPDRAHECPCCRESIFYRPRVEIKGVAAYDPEQHELPSNNDIGQIFRSSTFVCPHCGERLQAFIQLYIHKISRVARRDTASPPQSNLLEEEKRFLSKAKRSGLLKAFEEIVHIVNDVPEGRLPRNINRFFISYLRSAKEIRLRRPIILKLRHSHSGYLRFFQAQGVVMVIANARIVRFIPWRLIQNGDLLDGKVGRVDGTNLPSRGKRLGELMKTQVGYVPVGGQLLLTEILTTVRPHQNGKRDCRIR